MHTYGPTEAVDLVLPVATVAPLNIVLVEAAGEDSGRLTLLTLAITLSFPLLCPR